MIELFESLPVADRIFLALLILAGISAVTCLVCLFLDLKHPK